MLEPRHHPIQAQSTPAGLRLEQGGEKLPEYLLQDILVGQKLDQHERKQEDHHPKRIAKQSTEIRLRADQHPANQIAAK